MTITPISHTNTFAYQPRFGAGKGATELNALFRECVPLAYVHRCLKESENPSKPVVVGDNGTITAVKRGNKVIITMHPNPAVDRSIKIQLIYQAHQLPHEVRRRGAISIPPAVKPKVIVYTPRKTGQGFQRPVTRTEPNAIEAAIAIVTAKIGHDKI